MGFEHGRHGRSLAAVRSTACGSALYLMAVVLLAAAGCSSKHGSGKSAATPHAADSSATAGAGAQKNARPEAARHEELPAATSSHVVLTDHGCVQFEPRWSGVRVGQSLTFTSRLKTSVTVHVSPGAFEKAEVVIRPGATVSTGPARTPGSYSMWSEPAACQGAPLGAHGTGPGVAVEAAAPR